MAAQELEESFRKEEVGQQSQRLPGDIARRGLGNRGILGKREVTIDFGTGVVGAGQQAALRGRVERKCRPSEGLSPAAPSPRPALAQGALSGSLTRKGEEGKRTVQVRSIPWQEKKHECLGIEWKGSTNGGEGMILEKAGEDRQVGKLV